MHNKSLQLTPGEPSGTVNSVPMNSGCVALLGGATELYVTLPKIASAKKRIPSAIGNLDSPFDLYGRGPAFLEERWRPAETSREVTDLNDVLFGKPDEPEP